MASKITRFDPLDFLFHWGYVKTVVYPTMTQGLLDLQRQILDACVSATPQMLQNTRREKDFHLDISRATRDAHMEIYCYSVIINTYKNY